MTHNRKTLKSKNKLYDPGGSVNNKIFHQDNEVERMIAEVSNEQYISDQINKINSNQEPPLLSPFEEALSPEVALFSKLSKTRLMEISKLLWLPKKIDPYKPESEYVNGHLKNINTHSWFKINQISQEPQIDNLSCMTFSSTTANDLMDLSTNKVLTSQQKIDKALKEKEIENQSDKNKKKKYVKKEKTKTKNIVKYDPSKKGCIYIVTKKVDTVIYGRHCNDVREYGSDKCKNHIDKEGTNYDQMSNDLCKHIITQLSRGKDRKGMYCNEFTFNSPIKGYCNKHFKQHNEDMFVEKNLEDTVLRSIKVRIYPNKEQIKMLAKYFGCARFTYNKCVKDKFDGSKEDSRDKYVTESGNTYYNEDNINMLINPKKIIKTIEHKTYYVYPLIEFNERINLNEIIINEQAIHKILESARILIDVKDGISNYEQHKKLMKKCVDNINNSITYPSTTSNINNINNVNIAVCRKPSTTNNINNVNIATCRKPSKDNSNLESSGKVHKITKSEISYAYPLREFNKQMNPQKILISEQSKKNLDIITSSIIEDKSQIQDFNQFKELSKKYEANINKSYTYPVQKAKSFVEENTFLLACPKEVRAFAVREYITAKENMLKDYNKKLDYNKWKKDQNENHGENFKIKQVKYPKMKFKTKKEAQCITVNKEGVYLENGEIRIYPNMFSKKPLKIRRKCLKKDKKLMAILGGPAIFHDIKIYKTKINTYYLCLSSDVKKEFPILDNKNTASSDSGGKTFQTIYRFSEILEIGAKIDEQIIGMLDKIDENKKKKNDLYANKDIYTGDEFNERNKRYTLEHRRINEKLRNMINDMHEKAITKLLQSDIIYIPRLNTKRIVEQKDYNKKSKRVMNTLRHGAFIRKLKERAEVAGKIVIECSERLTTQICDVCFTKNKCESRTYKCESCKNVVDRDQHSSKLIFIKQITDIRQNDLLEIQINLV